MSSSGWPDGGRPELERVTRVTGEAGEAGTGPPPATGHPPDWRGMTRDAFDRDAPPATLFDLEPSAVPVAATADTADLLELIGDDT